MTLAGKDVRKELLTAFGGNISDSDPVIDELARGARAVSLQNRQFVFRSGDQCHAFLVLLEGSIRVQLTSAGGREITLYRIGPGGSCILTTSCLLSHERYPAEAITESDVVAVAFSDDSFQAALDSSRPFRDFVFDGFSTRLTDVISRIEQVALTPIDARLIKALLELAERGDDQVTHQQLAVELGTAREVVSRHLKKLEREGLLALGRGRIVIQDKAKLRMLQEKALV